MVKNKSTPFYPIGKLFDSGQVKVDNHTSIYYEQRGNPWGPAVVYNHGGPGGHASAESSQWFDPNHYRIILYDQRGTGNSIPSIRNKEINSDYFKDLTIDEMIADLEKLREYLSVPQWLVFGGSWGSTLSLYYSEKYPERVSGLIIYGIFLNSPQEMDAYFNIHCMKQRFPKLGTKAMQSLLDYANSQGLPIDPNHAQMFVDTYYQLCVLKNDPIAQYLWTAYEDFNDDPTEDALNNLYKRPRLDEFNPRARSISIFESSLFRYAYENFNVLNESLLTQLRNVNVRIIQGLSDTEAPPVNAQKLVDAVLKIKPDLYYKFITGKHDGDSSPEMRLALIESTDSFKKQAHKKSLLTDNARFFPSAPASLKSEEAIAEFKIKRNF
ncbi:MAG: alpha/beta fold hydrolase [Gammaproteobacteria bacterium]|nr:alpha/beta fold hydrolase [Gammaproteobacteria bacterium]